MPGERREAGSKGTVHAPPPHPARGNRQSASPVTPPLGIGNREWGIVGMGNGEADSLLLMKSGRGGRGRIALSIPHSRLPIPDPCESDPLNAFTFCFPSLLLRQRRL